MTQSEALYRAFVEYRKRTKDNGDCSAMREAIRRNAPDSDRITAEYSRCIIEEDWVNEIDKGLGYIERAIDEGRQFIRQQGDVRPIETVRQVSKKSVEHLAQHSENISHLPIDGETLIPDKLYVEEKLSDYGVYENRFLYMLLCYLRDFVGERYTRIKENWFSYRSEFGTEKRITVGQRAIIYRASFCEDSREDPYGMLGDEDSERLLKRIKEEQIRIEDLLKTPLMMQVSTESMLKPPVTRTNVLAMDVNFSGALALYDYVCDYRGDGFRIERMQNDISPFPEEMGDEFAELIDLTAFLTYEHGMELATALRVAYQAEELKRQEAYYSEELRRLSELRVQNPSALAEYTALLEERNSELEELIPMLLESESAVADKEAELRSEGRKNKELGKAVENLKKQNAQKDAENARIRSEALRKMAEAQKVNQDMLEEKERLCDQAISKINAECAERVTELQAELDSLKQKYTEAHAEIMACKHMNGVRIDEDLTEEERFKELEREYEALGRLIKKTWPKAKKKIRKKILWKK